MVYLRLLQDTIKRIIRGVKIEKYAAIDIGSNAIRVLISNVISDKNTLPKFMKSSMVRVPIRLGEDTFTVGEISDKNR